MKAWRIIKEEYLRHAFDGEGARLLGGRWNTKGTPIVYLASSLSLAALEMLVHLENADALKSYVFIPAEFSPNLVISAYTNKTFLKNLKKATIDPSKLLTEEEIGTFWASQQFSAVIKVPSAIIPQEYNYLLNPLHKDFFKIKIGLPQKFEFDNRLIKLIDDPT